MPLFLKKDTFAKYLMLSGLVLSLVTSCSNSDDDLLEDRPAEELYLQAMGELKNESYEQAAKVFDEVDRQHPYSKWATKAQLMAAFAHYQNQKYDKAVASLQTFMQLHPGHEDAAYAYYLFALCHYEQIYTVKRDQQMAELALSGLEDVIRRFPGTKYAKDAQLKVDLTRDHLAGKDMSVGRYYLKRGAYLSAINRFRSVVEKYQTTTHTPEALHRLTESYLSLGLADEAQAAASVLGTNFPGSPWYADSYFLLKGVDLRPDETKVKASWLNRLLGKHLEG